MPKDKPELTEAQKKSLKRFGWESKGPNDMGGLTIIKAPPGPEKEAAEIQKRQRIERLENELKELKEEE